MLELLHGGREARHPTEILETSLAPRTFGEGPEVRQDGAVNTTTAVGDADDDVLGGFTDEDLDGRDRGGGGGRRRRRGVSLDDGLDAVTQELTEDVLEVGRDVGERRVEVALKVDFRNGDVRAVGGRDELASGLGAALDDLLGVTFEEDLADEVIVGGNEGLLGVREVPGGMEGLGEGKMLLGNDATADAGAQEIGDEAVAFVGRDGVLDLEDAHDKSRDDGQVLLEALLDDVAESVVVVERADLRGLPQRFERGVIRLIDVADVLVRQGRIGQRLHLADPMRYARGQLQANIVGAAEQAGLGQGPAKEGELSQADGTRLTLDPVVQHTRTAPCRRDAGLRYGRVHLGRCRRQGAPGSVRGRREQACRS
nr:hypothetical protein CFP56_29948 [Quercus suber]